MTKPRALAEAEVLEALAQRYHKSPTELRRTEGTELLRHVTLLAESGYGSTD